MTTLLNLAAICPATHTLGPGQRFALWVQGCCFRCDRCVSPDWIPQRSAHWVSPMQLAEWILQTPGTQGVTLSGGEPMLQAAALADLLEILAQTKDLSVICFSGFTLAQLQAMASSSINRLLSRIDVLIDGLYRPELDDQRGWRGSSNQVVHHLTDRHRAEAQLFTDRRRDVELHVRQDHTLLVGIPYQGLLENLRDRL